MQVLRSQIKFVASHSYVLNFFILIIGFNKKLKSRNEIFLICVKFFLNMIFNLQRLKHRRFSTVKIYINKNFRFFYVQTEEMVYIYHFKKENQQMLYTKLVINTNIFTIRTFGVRFPLKGDELFRLIRLSAAVTSSFHHVSSVSKLGRKYSKECLNTRFSIYPSIYAKQFDVPFYTYTYKK